MSYTRHHKHAAECGFPVKHSVALARIYDDTADEFLF
jgi:hypothetical protein